TPGAIHNAEMHQSGYGGMRMRVNKSRRNGFAAEVDLLGSGAGKIHDLGIAAHGKKPVTDNRHGLSVRPAVIHGEDVPVVEDQVRLFLLQRKERKRSERA